MDAQNFVLTSRIVLTTMVLTRGYPCISIFGELISLFNAAAAVIYVWLQRPLPPSPASRMSVGWSAHSFRQTRFCYCAPRRRPERSSVSRGQQKRAGKRGRILKYDPSAAAPTHELLSLPFQFCSGNGKFKISCTGSSSHSRTLLPYSSSWPLPAQQPNTVVPF